MKIPYTVAIGVDITKISRFLAISNKNPSNFGRFTKRVFHPKEIQRLESLTPADSAAYMAGCWAAKEALFKTLDSDEQKKFEFKNWYRFSDDKKPYLGSDKYHKEEEFLLSISHDTGVLIATVLRQKYHLL